MVKSILDTEISILYGRISTNERKRSISARGTTMTYANSQPSPIETLLLRHGVPTASIGPIAAVFGKTPTIMVLNGSYRPEFPFDDALHDAYKTLVNPGAIDRTQRVRGDVVRKVHHELDRAYSNAPDELTGQGVASLMEQLGNYFGQRDYEQGLPELLRRALLDKDSWRVVAITLQRAGQGAKKNGDAINLQTQPQPAQVSGDIDFISYVQRFNATIELYHQIAKHDANLANIAANHDKIILNGSGPVIQRIYQGLLMYDRQMRATALQVSKGANGWSERDLRTSYEIAEGLRATFEARILELPNATELIKTFIATQEKLALDKELAEAGLLPA